MTQYIRIYWEFVTFAGAGDSIIKGTGLTYHPAVPTTHQGVNCTHPSGSFSMSFVGLGFGLGFKVRGFRVFGLRFCA